MPDASDASTISVLGATVMVANCAIGAGVLSFPYAVRCCGVAVGAVVIVLGAVLLGGSLHILASGSTLSGGVTYQSVIRRVLPPRLANIAGITLEATVFIYLLGVGAAFFNVISDQLLPLLLPAGTFLTAHCSSASDFGTPACRGMLIGLYAGVIELPLCLVRDLSFFRFSSGFAVVAIAYQVCVVIKYAVPLASHSDWVWVNTEQPLLIFKAVPLVLYAFNCHLAYIPIYQRLEPSIRHVASMDTVALGAYSLCLGAYLTTGIAGYLAFGEATPGDILQRLPTTAFNASLPPPSDVVCFGANVSNHVECCTQTSWACPWDAAIARVAIALTVSCSYPILQYVARGCLDDLLVQSGAVGQHSLPSLRWASEALLFVVVTGSVSTLEPRLTDILDVISTLFATLQVAALPALLVWYLYCPRAGNWRPIPVDVSPTAEPIGASGLASVEGAGTAVAAARPTAVSEIGSDAAAGVVVGDGLNSRLLPHSSASTLPSEGESAHFDPSTWQHTSGRDAVPATAPGKRINSYFTHAAAVMPKWRLRGLPHLSPTAAGSVALLYASVAMAAAALYYATLGVEAKSHK